jgi:pimeloyl-ACP methyl ester carboxylesterase
LIHHQVYSHSDQAPWLTFVHGAGGSSSIWFQQIRYFKSTHNLLLLDLRGHGNNKKTNDPEITTYDFDLIVNDIISILDYNQIQKTHFVGISLGTIIIAQLAKRHPQRLTSMIMGGAILKLNFRSQVLMRLGNVFKKLIPYLYLYQFFAYVIMPRSNHKKSRALFVNEAKKMNQKEFIKWFSLTSNINAVLNEMRQIEIEIPTLYIMGSEDYMFLPSVKQQVEKFQTFSKLITISGCGHVVNVDAPQAFNEQSLSFMAVL